MKTSDKGKFKKRRVNIVHTFSFNFFADLKSLTENWGKKECNIMCLGRIIWFYLTLAGPCLKTTYQ